MNTKQEFAAHESYVTDLHYAASGLSLFSAGMDNTVKQWRTSDWALQQTFSGHTKSVNSLALTPDQETLVSGSSDATVRVWDTSSGDTATVLQDRKRVVSTLDVSADGAWIAAGSYKGRVAIWTVMGDPVAAFPASRQNLAAVAFAPQDRTLLVTSGRGPAVKVWELPRGDEIATLAFPSAAVMRLVFSPDGRELMGLSYEGAVRVWRTTDWQVTGPEELVVPGARAIAVAASGRQVALASAGHVTVFDLPTWSRHIEFDVGANVLTSAVFSPDESSLAVGAADSLIRILDLAP